MNFQFCIGTCSILYIGLKAKNPRGCLTFVRMNIPLEVPFLYSSCQGKESGGSGKDGQFSQGGSSLNVHGLVRFCWLSTA